MKKLFFAYLLLAAFSFLALPKGLWHHHEQHEKHDEKKCHLHDKSILEEDCFVCDFIMSPATEARSLTFNFEHLDYFVPVKSTFDFKGIQLVDELSLRGPPAFIS